MCEHTRVMELAAFYGQIAVSVVGGFIDGHVVFGDIVVQVFIASLAHLDCGAVALRNYLPAFLCRNSECHCRT